MRFNLKLCIKIGFFSILILTFYLTYRGNFKLRNQINNGSLLDTSDNDGTFTDKPSYGENSILPHSHYKYIFCLRAKRRNEKWQLFLSTFWKNNFTSSDSWPLKTVSRLLFFFVEDFWMEGKFMTALVTDDRNNVLVSCNSHCRDICNHSINIDHLFQRCLETVLDMYESVQYMIISRDTIYINFKNIIQLLENQGKCCITAGTFLFGF